MKLQNVSFEASAPNIYMEKGFLHLHVTVVCVFIFLYAAKVFLLLANKSAALDKLRRKTKLADAVLGSLILVTGVFLLIKTPVVETYLLVKIVLVIASIPIGIIAMKKMDKALAIAAALIYVYVFAVAKTDSLQLKKEAFVTPAFQSGTATDSAHTIREGEVIFAAKCVLCHGKDGRLQLNGAKDLSVSTLTNAETIELIKSGNGLMPGFKDEFNEEQLNALAGYVEGLRK